MCLWMLKTRSLTIIGFRRIQKWRIRNSFHRQKSSFISRNLQVRPSYKIPVVLEMDAISSQVYVRVMREISELLSITDTLLMSTFLRQDSPLSPIYITEDKCIYWGEIFTHVSWSRPILRPVESYNFLENEYFSYFKLLICRVFCRNCRLMTIRRTNWTFWKLRPVPIATSAKSHVLAATKLERVAPAAEVPDVPMLSRGRWPVLFLQTVPSVTALASDSSW